VAALVLAYYVVLRSVLRSQPELRRCLTRCRHCGIFFLTNSCNSGRCDLGCPFGCQKAHRKHQSNRRSTAYYQDEIGKEKKRQQNAKRRKGAAAPSPSEAPPPASPPPPWPLPIVKYVRMVVSLIEGRQISLAEILEMLARAVRQHTMARRRRLEQTVASLHEQPP
jgi:hypothetical protein